MYGYCPKCGADVTGRERRINGNDTCATGHVYPSVETLIRKPQRPPEDSTPDAVAFEEETVRNYRIHGDLVATVERGLVVMRVDALVMEVSPEWAERFGMVLLKAAGDARGQ